MLKWEIPSLLKAPLCLLQSCWSPGSRQVGSIMSSCRPLSSLSKLGAPSLVGGGCVRSPELPGALSSTSPSPPTQTKCFSIVLSCLLSSLNVPSVQSPDNQRLCSLDLLVESWVGAGQVLAKEKCRSLSHRPHPVPLSFAFPSLGSFRP